LFIRNCLTPTSQLTVATTTDTVHDALEKMKFLLSVPCIDENGNFVGIVSKRTIFDALRPALETGITYEEFLKQPITPCIDSTIQPLELSNYFEETLSVIIRHPFVPIVEGKKLLGIVKRGDIHDSLDIVFGTDMESDRLLLGIAEVEGALYRLFSVTHRLGVNVITAVPFDAGEKALNRRVILRVEKSPKLDELVTQLERSGFYVISINR